jgi:hypothetical protein
MDKVQKHVSSNCNTPSEPFRINLTYSQFNIIINGQLLTDFHYYKINEIALTADIYKNKKH